MLVEIYLTGFLPSNVYISQIHMLSKKEPFFFSSTPENSFSIIALIEKQDMPILDLGFSYKMGLEGFEFSLLIFPIFHSNIC